MENASLQSCQIHRCSYSSSIRPSDKTAQIKIIFFLISQPKHYFVVLLAPHNMGKEKSLVDQKCRLSDLMSIDKRSDQNYNLLFNTLCVGQYTHNPSKMVSLKIIKDRIYH